MDDVTRVQDEFHILATSSLAAERPLVLKLDDTFCLSDPQGDFLPTAMGELGL